MADLSPSNFDPRSTWFFAVSQIHRRAGLSTHENTLRTVKLNKIMRAVFKRNLLKSEMKHVFDIIQHTINQKRRKPEPRLIKIRAANPNTIGALPTQLWKRINVLCVTN